MQEPIVTFVLISYMETRDFYVSLGSLLCQRSPNWLAIVYHDGPNDNTRRIVKYFDDPRISYIEAPKNTGSWGCYNRIESLKLVTTPFIIQTTAQEYYCPIVVNSIENLKDADMVLWDTAHHQFDYNTLNAYPRAKQIDWSNFALKTSIAKKVGINHPKEFCADGLFVEDVIKSGLAKKIMKIPKVLSIKN